MRPARVLAFLVIPLERIYKSDRFHSSITIFGNLESDFEMDMKFVTVSSRRHCWRLWIVISTSQLLRFRNSKTGFPAKAGPTGTNGDHYCDNNLSSDLYLARWRTRVGLARVEKRPHLRIVNHIDSAVGWKLVKN